MSGKRKRNAGVKSGPFKRHGHRSTTSWARMAKQNGYQERLEQHTKMLRRKYVAARPPPSLIQE